MNFNYYLTPYQSIVEDKNLYNLTLFEPYTKKLTAILGNTKNGIPLYLDLETAPHVLIGGATGSGKSVCANTILHSLFLKNNPDDLMVHLIDPKKVDYIEFSDMPFIKSYSTEPNQVADILKNIEIEMYKRYNLLQFHKVKNMKNLNQKFPSIIVVFDEFASLINKQTKREIVPTLENILRLGRAADIHLLLITQRPDSTVITGQTKANCPCRIAFRLPSATDSRVLLDQRGAEKLQGQGDGLLINSDGSRTDFQGLMIPEEQADKIIKFWNSQPLTQTQINNMKF